MRKSDPSAKNRGQSIADHFARVTKMVKIGSGTERSIDDYNLSRYACYLIAQNGDPRKEEIALAQTYFVIQTRKQEVQELLVEDGKRVYLRDEMKEGLYGGLRQKDIHARKRLKKVKSSSKKIN
ncbi:hypothetical protein HZB07_03590 [Candidatus Saganbacteria bacterium]|nr:hypothetical protein [Candidatus Saganbacteria bacterium]